MHHAVFGEMLVQNQMTCAFALDRVSEDNAGWRVNPDGAWLEQIETPFFGPVTRVRLLSHVLFHTAHHAGQIALTLSRPGAGLH